MNREEWFPTSIYYEDIKLDFNDLITKCYKLKDNQQSVNKSNQGGWQSEDISKNDDFKDLINKILELSKEPFNEFYPSMKGKYKISNIWININQENTFNLQHIHPFTDLSGCLYLKTPKNSGDIWFEDPRFIQRMNEIGTYATETRLTFHKIYYPPLPGRILFFPNWLRHSVEINKSQEDRISIAFNLKLEFEDK